MISYTAGSHHMKYFVQRTDSTRQSYHYFRFLQHNIFPVAQVYRMKCHIKQVADSAMFLQFSGNNSHYHSSVFFRTFSKDFHQSCIGAPVNQPFMMLA